MAFPQASSKREPLRILLTGATGQLGGDLLPLLQPHATAIAPNRDQLDLCNESEIRALVREVKPHWIINPAAYTAVDAAEREPELATAINSNAPRILGEEAVHIGAAVVHFSTDYVFDGGGDQPWREDDPTNPLSVYGKTKLAGEVALARTGAAHLIFRTSWVYGTRGKNFLLNILRLAQEREEVRIVADQFGAPTLSSDLARLVGQVISQVESVQDGGSVSRAQTLQEKQGVYHAAAAGATSWFGFAQEFLRLAAVAEPNKRWASLSPIKTADYPTAARRPLNSRLDCSRLYKVFGYKLPSWQTATAATIQQLFGTEEAKQLN